MGGAASSDSGEPTHPSSIALADLRLDGKKIAILSYGSRGDVQPFVALGVRLKSAGCSVLVVSNVDHQEFVTSFSLDFVGTAPSCRDDHKRPEFVQGIATNEFKEFWAWQLKSKGEMADELNKKECDALEGFGPDLIYATPLTYPNACTVADRLKTPMILGSLFPMGNFMSFLGFRFLQAPKHPTLIHWSPALTKVPPLLQLSHRVTGFLVVEEQGKHEEDSSIFGGDADRKRLEEFLARGEPPVYMGWGSMIVPSSVAGLAVRALKHAGLRGVILGGWAGLGAHMLDGESDRQELEEYAAGQVLFLQSAPHEWLFPRCAATVHHGGAGTVAAALRAGVPTVITPCFGDQPDNAHIVEENGCGLAMGQISTVKAEELGEALKKCTTDKDMRARCSALSEQLRSEDGLHATACAVGGYLRVLDESKADTLAGPLAEWKKAWKVKQRMDESGL